MRRRPGCVRKPCANLGGFEVTISTRKLMKSLQIRNLTVAVLLVAATLRATADVSIGYAPADKTTGTPAEKQRQLIAILKSNSQPAEKAVACKRLAVYGTKDAVP